MLIVAVVFAVVFAVVVVVVYVVNGGGVAVVVAEVEVLGVRLWLLS